MTGRIHITHARLVNKNGAVHCVRFNIFVDKPSLEDVRQDIKRAYNVPKVLFVYDECV